jgi:hypothetical protein
MSDKLTDNYVINPRTGNPIKIGSKLYKQLLKDNILQLDFNTRKNPVVFNGTGDKEFKTKFNPSKNMNLIYRNGKLVENRRKTTTVENINHITIKSAEVIKEHLNEFTDDMDDDEIYKKVKMLLSQKIIGEPPPPPPPKFQVEEGTDIDILDVSSDNNSDSD